MYSGSSYVDTSGTGRTVSGTSTTGYYEDSVYYIRVVTDVYEEPILKPMPFIPWLMYFISILQSVAQITDPDPSHPDEYG